MRTIGASVHCRYRGGGSVGAVVVGVKICSAECPVGLLALAKGGKIVGQNFEDETIDIMLTLLVEDMPPLIIAVVG